MAERLDATLADDLQAMASEMDARQCERPPGTEPPQPYPCILMKYISGPPTIRAPLAQLDPTGDDAPQHGTLRRRQRGKKAMETCHDHGPDAQRRSGEVR